KRDSNPRCLCDRSGWTRVAGLRGIEPRSPVAFDEARRCWGGEEKRSGAAPQRSASDPDGSGGAHVEAHPLAAGQELLGGAGEVSRGEGDERQVGAVLAGLGEGIG